jgi:hypothetical protein
LTEQNTGLRVYTACFEHFIEQASEKLCKKKAAYEDKQRNTDLGDNGRKGFEKY